MMVKYAVFIICSTIAWLPAAAQNNAPVAPPIIVDAGDVYNPFIAKQSRLYNGAEHLGYSARIKGHAYYEQNKPDTGTVVYDGLTFTNVPMLYDLLKDQVVILHFNNFTKLALTSEKLQAFTFLKHHFVRLEIDSLSNAPLRTGFYDEVYTNKLKVLVKRAKIINEEVKDQIERDFRIYNQYFIEKAGTWYAVKNYRGLLNLLQDRAKEIRQYLRKNGTKFRKQPELAILKAVAYYDSLNN